jgi:hypothetical protein
MVMSLDDALQIVEAEAAVFGSGPTNICWQR